MTLSELSTLLPPPEGMEWQQRPRAPKDYMLVVVGTGEQVGHVFTDAPLSDANDHPCVVSMTAADRHYREIVAPPDLPSAYLRALAAVGLAPDPEKEALRAEVADLRRTVRECPTCEGSGSMGAVVGVTAPDGEDVIEDVTCAECHGTGVSSWGEALDEAERLRLEVANMRRRLTWSEDVPTGDGLVLVWHPGDDEPEMWRTLGTADGIQWEHHNYVGHGNPFPPGTRFFPLANLKETR